MSIFKKFTEMARQSVDALDAGIDKTVKSLKEEGLQATSYKIGKQVGAMVKEVQDDVTEYTDEISKSNKKATNPLSIPFKKGTASHTTAKTVVTFINTMRIIGGHAQATDLLKDKKVKNPTL